MAYYFQERLKYAPVRGLTGMGGGSVLSGAKSSSGAAPFSCDTSTAGYCSAQSYSFPGSQTVGTQVFDSGTPGPAFSSMPRFTIQWDVWIDATANSNNWHMQATPGWNSSEGILIGIYATWKVAIAGPQLGGYGFQANDDLPSGAWRRIKYQFGVSGNGAIGGQALFYSSDGGATFTSQGTHNTHNQPTVTWNQGIWAGAGRQTSGSTWSEPFAGDVRNLELWDTIV